MMLINKSRQIFLCEFSELVLKFLVDSMKMVRFIRSSLQFSELQCKTCKNQLLFLTYGGGVEGKKNGLQGRTPSCMEHYWKIPSLFGASVHIECSNYKTISLVSGASLKF